MKKNTIETWIHAINQQNLEMIIEMMAEDFIFIDCHGKIETKEQMKTGWAGYFDWFPDYVIEVQDYLENSHFSVILGKASASFQGKTEKYWEIPAGWKVIVKGNQICLWQVFCDSKKQLDSMKE